MSDERDVAAAILARRFDNGADYWATPDGRLAKGGPLSTLGAARLLVELGVDPSDPVRAAATELIWRAWREDGRFRLAPVGAIYPCQTAHAACTLAHLGHADDPRLQRTFEQLLSTQHTDCGWRCNKFSYGRGPETEFSNPGPTLIALDAFRFTERANSDETLDRAVEFLLSHWVTRAPLGPCHYGIGTLFLQVSYPLADYHLFSWVQVLSHYRRARGDPRFLQAFATLQAKLVDGQVVPERVSPALAKLGFCRRGEPSTLATGRYRELESRLTHADDG
ncbi:MAG TPA: hypothetical protein VGK18_09290 [Propionicimonas sp.]|uniref:hypothetical protein n=1 Tax=Propionicimonas sp. TaxID=1955623 RepID=UPI002F3E8A34